MTRKVPTFVLAATLAASPLLAQQSQGGGAETRFGQRIAAVVRDRLGLTEAQMQKLQQVNRTYEQKRRIVAQQERDIRMSLREEMVQATPSNDRVSDLITRMLKTQRDRIDLLEQEQKELATFMTPVQRAKYLALQDQIRRRVNEMRQRAASGQGGRGRRLRPGAPAP